MPFMNQAIQQNLQKLIASVQRHEVWAEGAVSHVKRGMDMEVFVKALEIYKRQNNFHDKYRMTTMMKYQYHLIGRSDDIINFKITDVEVHPIFSHFALQTKVCWSKNVIDERKCPDQILIFV
jgi:hypothetical protein